MADPEIVDWEAFYEATLERPLHPVFSRLEPHLPNGGTAVELGCGVGAGVLWLLDRGFHVVAVDRDQRALDIVQRRLPEGARCRVVLADLADYSPPPAEVVVAGFSLFFLPRAEFQGFWARLRASLRPGGLFAGQLLGVDDDWRRRGYTVHTADEVRDLFEGFEILDSEEANRPGKTTLREEKHWHVFHVVARRAPPQ